MTTKTIQLLFFLLFLPILSAAQSVSDLATVDIVPERIEAIDALIEHYVDQGWIPGGVFIAARKGEVIYRKTIGKRSVSGPNYESDDIFRLASMTKAVTTVSIMQLVERGRLGLDDPIHYHIPAFKDMQVLDEFDASDSTYTTVDAERQITIRQLLTHTSGITYGPFNPGKISIVYQKFGLDKFGLSHPEMSTEEMANQIAKAPLIFQPGDRYMYGLNMEILGRIVEVASGLSLAEYFEQHIFSPLGMDDTRFYLPEEKHDRLVPVYTLSAEGKLIDTPAEQHAPMEYPKANFSNYAGGGGLSGTAEDYLRFVQTLLDDGEYNGFELLSRKSIEVMTSDQMILLNQEGKGMSKKPGLSYGLGFALHNDVKSGGSFHSPGTYAWGGVFNTKFFIDPAEDLVFVGMTQILPFGHQEFWDRLYTVIYAALD